LCSSVAGNAARRDARKLCRIGDVFFKRTGVATP